MNIRSISVVALAAMCAIVCGCQSTGVKEPNAATAAKLSSAHHSEKATVVVYRPRSALGAILSPTVQIDGKSLVDIDNGHVFVGTVAPGHHVFQIENQNSGTEVTLKSGGTIYLKVEIEPGFWKGNGKLTQVAPEQGEFEAKRLELIDPEQIAPAFR
jgi:Protein of unknown function (DUF2846)